MDGKHSSDLEEELMDSLIDISDKRSEMPKKCADLVAETLRLQQSLVENSIVLPKTDVKKLPCKYSLNKPLKNTFNLPKVQTSVQDISTLIARVRQEQKNLAAVVKICNNQTDL